MTTLHRLQDLPLPESDRRFRFRSLCRLAISWFSRSCSISSSRISLFWRSLSCSSLATLRFAASRRFCALKARAGVVWLSSLPETSKCPRDSQPGDDPESEVESELTLLGSSSLDWSSFRLALTWSTLCRRVLNGRLFNFIFFL